MVNVTLKDIAQKLNISEATVSLALNNYPGVSKKTKERVLQCAEEMNYVPNPIARGLATRRTMTIGLVCPDSENPCFGKIIKRITYYCEQCGYSVLLGISDGDVKREASVIRQFISCHVDGIVILPVDTLNNDAPVFNTLRQHELPCVFTFSYYPGFEDDCVLTDYAAGSYELTKRMLKAGHRTIWYFVTKELELPVTKLRLEGWKRAYEEMGLEWKQEWIIPCDYTDSGFAYYIAGRVLNERVAPDAICTLNDYMASGVRKAILDAGFRIPEDISLAGYDDTMDIFYMDMPMTSVRQDLDGLAKETVRLLMQKINHTDGEKDPVQRVILPELAIRKTTRL